MQYILSGLRAEAKPNMRANPAGSGRRRSSLGAEIYELEDLCCFSSLVVIPGRARWINISCKRWPKGVRGWRRKAYIFPLKLVFRIAYLGWLYDVGTDEKRSVGRVSGIESDALFTTSSIFVQQNNLFRFYPARSMTTMLSHCILLMLCNKLEKMRYNNTGTGNFNPFR